LQQDFCLSARFDVYVRHLSDYRSTNQAQLPGDDFLDILMVELHSTRLNDPANSVNAEPLEQIQLKMNVSRLSLLIVIRNPRRLQPKRLPKAFIIKSAFIGFGILNRNRLQVERIHRGHKIHRLMINKNTDNSKPVWTVLCSDATAGNGIPFGTVMATFVESDIKFYFATRHTLSLAIYRAKCASNLKAKCLTK
jgi:hypothetical protein